jgi:hypothetical protein
MFGWKIEVGRWYAELCRGEYSELSIGIGWWVKGHWRERCGWIMWNKSYYDGNWFCARLGPFFFSRGPY